MRDEDLCDLPEVVAGTHDAAQRAVAGVDEVRRAVHHEQVRRLRAVRARQGAATRAERDENRALRRRLRLREAYGRERECDAGERDRHGAHGFPSLDAPSIGGLRLTIASTRATAESGTTRASGANRLSRPAGQSDG